MKDAQPTPIVEMLRRPDAWQSLHAKGDVSYWRNSKVPNQAANIITDLLEAMEGLLDGMPLPHTASEYELVQAGCDPAEARKIAAASAAISRARNGGNNA